MTTATDDALATPQPVRRMARISPARRRVAAAQLRAARMHRGLTQDQLARMLDVRVPTVSDRETSSVGVPWETWLAVAFVLDLPAEWEPLTDSTDDKPVR